MIESNIDNLRRLRVLQALQRTEPDPLGEDAILHIVQVDPELSPTIERIRKSLTYLGEIGFVEIITLDDTEWMAGRITVTASEWLSNTNPASENTYDMYHPSDKPAPDTTRSGRGRVSSITTLPTEAKAWLDQELVRRHFTGYVDLADLLAQQGYEISKSAIGRYGKKFKDEQKQLRQSIEMAKALIGVVGDDGAAMNQTLTLLAQQEMMAVIREGRYDDSIKLPALIRSISSLNRSDINTRNYQIEQAARSQALNEAADAVEHAAQQKGMDAKDAQFWREQVLGVK